MEDVESLLVALILDGRLDGKIDQVNGVLVKSSSLARSGEGGGVGVSGSGGKMSSSAMGASSRTGNVGDAKRSTFAENRLGDGSVESRNTESIMQLTAALERLTNVVSKVGSKGASLHQQVMQ